MDALAQAMAEANAALDADVVAPSDSVERVLSEILDGKEHRCGPVHATEDQFARLVTAIEAKVQAQAERMPDEKAAIDQMFDAFDRLRRLGWQEAIYCPKDGTVFEVIEAGSTGVFDCHYEGEWPKGSWWARDGEDLWPSRPILFRFKASPAEADQPKAAT